MSITYGHYNIRNYYMLLCIANGAPNATKYLFCCVRFSGLSITMGRGRAAAGGLLRAAGRAAGAGPWAAWLDGHGGGVAEKRAGRAQKGRLIYDTLSPAPSDIRMVQNGLTGYIVPLAVGIVLVLFLWAFSAFL